MEDCIFCKIIKKEIPAEIVSETESLIAIVDINPSAETHILLVPKDHIESFMELDPKSEYLVDAVNLAQKLIQEDNVKHAYRMLFNGGKYQHVKHLHWHIQGGKLTKYAIDSLIAQGKEV